MADVKRARVEMEDGREFEGFIIPETEASADDILLLKLDNGYNVGLSKKKIKKKEIIEGEAPIQKVPRAQVKGRGPTVSVVGTGGTIASRVDYFTGGVKASMDTDEILAAVPEAAQHAQLRFTNLFNKLSEDMVPQNWADIAAEVHSQLSDSEGVVVLHGTDTMHYTASALSFMLETPKPVVLTGAQRSSDRPSTDAFQNILCSLHTAQANLGEVVVCFHAGTSDDYNHVLRGNRSRKMHTSARSAFKSINCPPLARVWPGGKWEDLAGHSARGEGEAELQNAFEPKVALVKVFPGSDPSVLDYYASEGYKGIVLEGTGLGHVPVDPDNGRGWLPTIRELRDDLAIVVTSQALYGRTHRHVYTNLRKLSRLGAVFVGDMLPETAYTKLVWALGNFDMAKVPDIMKKNLHGELSPRTLQI